MLGSAAFRTGIAPGGALAGPWVRNPLWTLARAVPSLDLRFADNKSLVDATTGASLVTFTRASSATYVGSDGLVKTATTNEARFDHNPTTGESLGLLVEEARTNLALRSEEFSDATWVKALSTVTANTGSAPDGTTTADTFTRTTTGPNYVTQNLAKAASAIQYTYSVFAKQSVGSFCTIRLQGTYPSRVDVVFNLSSATISTVATVFGSFTGPSASITPYANGWYRLAVTGTSDATVGLAIHASFNSNGVVIDGNDSVANSAGFLWGAQLEAGAFATSYIPTTSATVTRAADVASITGTNFSSWYNQAEGTVFANATAAVAASILPCYASIDNGTTSERLQLRRVTNGTSPSYRVVAGGQSIDSATKTIGSPTGFNSHVLAYASSNYEGACNGTLEGLTSIVNRPTATQLQIGNGAGSAAINGTIKRLVYWGQRLPNNVLQAISAP